MNQKDKEQEATLKSFITLDEVPENRQGDRYEDLLADIKKSFAEHIKNGEEPLFATDANSVHPRGLYGVFLDALPEEARQHYNCNACRSFFNRYATLVRIDDSGNQFPVMLEYEPDFFSDAFGAAYEVVADAKVTGVFITDQNWLGTPETGPWTHMAVPVPAKMRFKSSAVKPVWEARAEKDEELGMLRRAIAKYQTESVKKAVNLLQSDELYRSEKVLGVAEWFLDVKINAAKHRGDRLRNYLWKTVATAPTGFCHVSSSMIGTLLNDIEAGFHMETIRRRFNEKMNPLQYQRPQAAPSAQNVARAEKIVKLMGIEESFRRRYAGVEELQTIWTPLKATEKKYENASGLFAGIETKQTRRIQSGRQILPEQTMTWEKFRRTVLPEAEKIEFMVTGEKDSFSAIMTAAVSDAKPIIMWDSEEHRNPFSWYLYPNGTFPGNWNLRPGFCEVTAVTLQPNLWRDGFEHCGKAVFFILDKCHDAGCNRTSPGLFPEILKSELREVRATIEAYNKSHHPEGANNATACGIRLQASNPHWKYKFKVTTDVGVRIITLDRWD